MLIFMFHVVGHRQKKDLPGRAAADLDVPVDEPVQPQDPLAAACVLHA